MARDSIDGILFFPRRIWGVQVIKRDLPHEIWSVVRQLPSLVTMLKRYWCTLQYVLIGLLGGSTVLFWRQTVNMRLRVATSKQVSSIETLSWTKRIEPLNYSSVIRSLSENRTLKWLDLWMTDPNCTRFHVHLLQDRSVEPAAFVSYPGSGNTWLQMLIMGLTGVFISSVYKSDVTFEARSGASYLLDVDCGCTLLQKTHDFTLEGALKHLPYSKRTDSLIRFQRRAILLIRNPFKAILAYRNFCHGGMTGSAPKSYFQGSDWDGFVTRSIASWETLATVWIGGMERGGVLYYESLQQNPSQELNRLADMLGMNEIDHQRLDCVLRHRNDNTFKRIGASNYPSQPFSETQRMLIHKAIDRVQTALRERGLQPLPVDHYQFYESDFGYGKL